MPEDLRKYREYDPDELKGRSDDAHAVIFIDGELYVDRLTGRSHRGFFNKAKDATGKQLRARLSPELELQQGDDGWFELYDTYLFGRVAPLEDPETGETLRFASFWGRGADYDNPEAKGPVDQIPACVQALYYKDLVDDDTIIVFGDGRVCLASDLLHGGKGVEAAGEIDPEVQKRMELQKQIHLARGDEKKQLLKAVGAKVGGGKVSPWSRELRKGGSGSGWDYWRMHSENFAARLDRILLGICNT